MTALDTPDALEADAGTSRRAPRSRPVRRPARSRAAGHVVGGAGAVVTAVFALVGWIVGSARLGDNSFFWHLRTGGYILDHGIPHRDVFSYTARGTSWIAQSWLAEVTYAVIERTVGIAGVRVFTGLVGVAVAVLAYRLAVRLSGSWLRGRGIAAVSTARAVRDVDRASARVGRALPPRPAVGRRGPGVMGRSSPAGRGSRPDLALGERARLVRTRPRVPRAPRARSMGRRRAAVGGRAGAHARDRDRDRRARLARQPVRLRPVDVPRPAAVAGRDPVARLRVAVARLP